MDRTLVNAIAEAMRETDVTLHNDIEPFDYYEHKAEAALNVVEHYQPVRARSFHVEGVQWA